MDKGKRAKVSEEEETCDPVLVEAIEKLQEVQDELEKVNEEASEKVLEIEQKYNEIRKPVYGKRSEIISTIPDFWLTAFQSHPALFTFLTDDDQKVFKYLQSIDVEDSKDVKSGFTISFQFKPNPYFENETLSKVFKFSEDGNVTIVSTEINWKKDMDITNGNVEEEKEGNKRLFDESSFFKWFESIEDEKADYENLHDEIADIIKDDLWPNPLKYFSQEADEEDEDDDGEFDEEDGDEGEDEEDEGNDE